MNNFSEMTNEELMDVDGGFVGLGVAIALGIFVVTAKGCSGKN